MATGRGDYRRFGSHGCFREEVLGMASAASPLDFVTLRFSEISKQGAKSFLFEMAVVGEYFIQPCAAHRIHGDAIGKAVSLVRAGTIKMQAGEKQLPALRNDTDY
jgi:hypothetical protein